MVDKITEPLPLDKEQIPLRVNDTPLPLRSDQIPGNVTDNRPPTTTKEQDTSTASHREINLMWESNQGRISLAVVGTTLVVAAILSLSALRPSITDSQMAIAVAAFMLLNSLVSGVIGYYFGRTNHEKVGGVGVSPAERREGR